jgi:hypothetical protein
MANVLTLQWVKDAHGAWHALHSDSITGVWASGVYMIWKSAAPGAVVRVGQGIIRQRLSAHRADPFIVRHTPQGGRLLVSWAAVPFQYRDGVERYLAELYTPLEGDRFPDVPPIRVNTPA